MSLILKQLFGLLKILNSDTGENQIAVGIACGLILGFAPAFSLQTLVVFICLFFFRIQAGAAFVPAFFFALVAFLLDPLFDMIGGRVLEISALREIFTYMYNMPLVPFTKFYNSVVMGAGVMSVILFPFVFIFAKKVIYKYRNEILARFKETKFWKAVKATSFYKWYAKYNALYE